ncbi:MAG: CDP-alcohol phosphatidyltransferase family protein [Dehalococcoidia bacterium]
MESATPYHEPARDRLLGPLTNGLGRALTRRVPPAALSLGALLAAAGAFAVLLLDAPLRAGLLILLAAALDAAGAAAERAGGAVRPFGSVVDGVADRLGDTFILAGMAVWSHRHEAYPGPLAVGFAALIGVIVLAYAVARVRASGGREAARVFGWAGRDLRLLVLAAGALTGQVYWALALVALLANGAVFWALLALRGRLPADRTP